MSRLFPILKHWLELHIFLCTVGPILIIYHTAMKIGGLVAVSFWCMIAVVLSGFVGRFIYGQIPRSIQGKELDINELNKIDEELSGRIESEISNQSLKNRLNELKNAERYRNITFGKSVQINISDYYTSRDIFRMLKKEFSGKCKEKEIAEILSVVKEKIKIARQIGMLRTMRNLFRNWPHNSPAICNDNVFNYVYSYCSCYCFWLYMDFLKEVLLY